MNRRRLSLIYLVCETLALLGFIAFFNRWPQPLLGLFILAIPFYLAALTFTIWIHPVLCLVVLVKRIRAGEGMTLILVHLIWSLAVSGIFCGMILNGYIITV